MAQEKRDTVKGDIRVGVLSYPMLFQRTGGLQVQVTQTIEALRKLNLDAVMCNPAQEKLSAFDVVHVFSARHGNDQVIEMAKQLRVPCVLSSLINMPWAQTAFVSAKLADRITGRLTGWRMRTTFGDMERAVAMSDHVIALGSEERSVLTTRFHKAGSKVSLIPNGVADQFLTAQPQLAWERLGGRFPFVFCAGAVSHYKGQHRIVEAIKDLDVKLVLAGPAQNEAYLQTVLAAGGAKVVYVGSLAHSDPLLASLYAAASVSVLVSNGEISPVSLLECLAAGTPFVLTRHNSVELARDRTAWHEVEPSNPKEIADAIRHFLNTEKPQAAARQAVSSCTWHNVAHQIRDVYRKVLSAEIAPTKALAEGSA